MSFVLPCYLAENWEFYSPLFTCKGVFICLRKKTQQKLYYELPREEKQQFPCRGVMFISHEICRSVQCCISSVITVTKSLLFLFFPRSIFLEKNHKVCEQQIHISLPNAYRSSADIMCELLSYQSTQLVVSCSL